jgi:hypothetical protein
VATQLLDGVDAERRLELVRVALADTRERRHRSLE